MKNTLFSLLLFLPTFGICNQVSLQEMIAQMIMVGFEGTKKEDKWVRQIRIDINKQRIGGILLFDRNIKSPEQLKALTSNLQLKTPLPTLIAIDQEGGLVTRLTKEKGFRTYPSARKVGENKNIGETYKLYKEMAKYLKSFGINYNLAPVVDITSLTSGFQKKRTFNKYPSIITSYAQSFVDAFKEENVLTSLKHFPGYGNAASDTHKIITDTTQSWSFDELMPYFYLIQSKNIQSIMVGHTYLKRFDTQYPSSLSYEIVTEILRKQMKYDGVVISDDLLMKGIGKEFDIKKRIILSIKAGVDILIFSDYFLLGKSTPKAVMETILEAINQGKISKDRIKQSYLRIVKMKSLIQ